MMTILETHLEDGFASYQRIWPHQTAQTTLIADLLDAFFYEREERAVKDKFLKVIDMLNL